MSEPLEFLRNVPVAAATITGAATPLRPVAPRASATLRADLEKRLAGLDRERLVVLARLRADHRQYLDLDASAAAVVDAMIELERQRLADRESNPDSGDRAA